MIRKVPIGIFILLTLFGCTSIEKYTVKVDEYEQKIEQKYNIDIVYNVTRLDKDPFEMEIPSIRYVYHYFLLLDTEINKYPKDFFEKIGITQIVLGKNLIVKGGPRAASPYPFKGRIYYEVEKSNHEYGDSFLAYALHHEIYHCIDYSLWGDMCFEWDQWQKLNINNFQYGEGGESAYKENYQEPELVRGFLETYQMLGQEEDRATLFGCAMTEAKKHYLLSGMENDEIVQRKYNLLEQIIGDYFGFSLFNKKS